MIGRIRALQARLKDILEVSALTDRDLADLGLSRGQIERLVRMPKDVPDRVAAMASIFGLTESQIRKDHGQYLELTEICGGCSERDNCSGVLAKGQSAQPEDAGFCPNSGTYRDLGTPET